MTNVKYLRKEWLDRLNALCVASMNVPKTGDAAHEQAVHLHALAELLRGAAVRYAGAEDRELRSTRGLS